MNATKQERIIPHGAGCEPTKTLANGVFPAFRCAAGFISRAGRGNRKPTASRLTARRTRPIRTLAVVATLVALVGLVGCGRKPKRLEVFPVEGKIVYGKKAPAGATVVLHPVDNPTLPRPTGEVATDGTFKVRTYNKDDGAPAGKYKVTVQLYQHTVKGDEVVMGKNLLPEKYADPTKTDLQIEVAANPNRLPPLTLKR